MDKDIKILEKQLKDLQKENSDLKSQRDSLIHISRDAINARIEKDKRIATSYQDSTFDVLCTVAGIGFVVALFRVLDELI